MSDDECEYSVRHEESDEGEDSVGEDAELELSCALQDLALRVKTFEENMKGRFRDAAGGSDEIDDEIDEDIPEADAPVPEAAPKQHRRRKDAKKFGSKAACKQQEDEEDEDDNPYGDDEFSDDDNEDDDEGEGAKGDRDDDWDYQEQTEELSELKHNIAMLLEGFKEEAKALELGGEDNQAK